MKIVDDPPTLDRGPGHEVLRQYSEQLRVPLTEEQHRLKGIELAQKVQELVALEEEHKEERKQMKADELLLKSTILELKQDVQLQSERRPVDVEDVADFARGVVETVRIDTGKIVRSRGLQEHERQQSLT